MLTRLDHIDLKVPNLETAVAFFASIGLIEIRRTDPARRSVEMALPGDGQVLFEIREVAGVEKTTIDHIAFSVDNTRSTLEALKAVGVEFSREAHLVAHTGRTVSNFKDSQGAKWQLSE